MSAQGAGGEAGGGPAESTFVVRAEQEKDMSTVKQNRMLPRQRPRLKGSQNLTSRKLKQNRDVIVFRVLRNGLLRCRLYTCPAYSYGTVVTSC